MRQGAWQEHVLKGSAHIIVARKWGRGFKSRAPQSLLRAHPNDLTPSTRLHLSKFPPPLNSGMPGNRPLINGALGDIPDSNYIARYKIIFFIVFCGDGVEGCFI